MLKARRLGYDGYGNATCADEVEARVRSPASTSATASSPRVVAFERELAVMVARAPGGAEAAYPVVETVQANHVCHEVVAPAQIAPEAAARAGDVAQAAAAAANGLGVTGVEMFLVPGGEVLVNARPAPPQLGPLHHRGGRDLPVREPPARRARPAAGRGRHARAGNRDGQPAGLAHGAAAPDAASALAVPGAHLHLYDKAEVRPGRKMGHVTALDDTAEDALARARRAAAAVGL